MCPFTTALHSVVTDDCRSQQDNRHILKCADDSAIVSLLHADENDHGLAVDESVHCCDRASLQLDVAQTKDVLTDFKCKPSAPQSITIKGQVVEVVDTYKYLGSLIDSKLKFNPDTGMIGQHCSFQNSEGPGNVLGVQQNNLTHLHKRQAGSEEG